MIGKKNYFKSLYLKDRKSLCKCGNGQFGPNRHKVMKIDREEVMEEADSDLQKPGGGLINGIVAPTTAAGPFLRTPLNITNVFTTRLSIF